MVMEKNQDNKCFLWHVLAHLHPVKQNADRVANYEGHIDELKVDGISMPMKVDQVEKFEKLNDLTINVYMSYMSAKHIWPIYISKRGESDPINLLLL